MDQRFLLGIFLVFATMAALASDTSSVHYPPSARPGELSLEATFHLWVPPKAKHLRALIVHQHGCGEGAERSGEMAALDLHWRALAERHHAGLLSPHYHAGTNKCSTWCDPRKGSDTAFLRALNDLAEQSGHSELTTVPWCLWGHSGGGYWVSLMLALHPERIAGAFCRSGAANMWANEVGDLKYPAAAFMIPVMLNPGTKEKGDSQFNGAWTGTWQFFEEFRAKGAPVAFAPDPFSSHNCRNSRLVAIPFFDACLKERLARLGTALKVVQQNRGFVGDWRTGAIRRSLSVTNELSWLPNENCARAFSEYVKHGITTDTTAPETAPVITNLMRTTEGVVVEWSARADFESGIRQFTIYRNGKLLTRLPENPKDPTGFAQFQTLSYHDTPTPDAPMLRFIDTNALSGEVWYALSIINGAQLEGPRSKPARLRE